MRPPVRIYIDFAEPTRRARVAGALLCVAGVGAAVAVGVAFNGELATRGQLDAELGTLSQSRRPAAPANVKAAEDAAAVQHELSIPWTALLAELESASHDSAGTISLLQVEPDVEKRVVKITAEARSLADAFGYLERLQQSKVLRYPMLESHERKKDDAEHPFRIKLAAEWRT